MAATGRWALHLTPRAHKTRQRFPRPLWPSRRACVEQSTVGRSSLAPKLSGGTLAARYRLSALHNASSHLPSPNLRPRAQLSKACCLQHCVLDQQVPAMLLVPGSSPLRQPESGRCISS